MDVLLGAERNQRQPTMSQGTYHVYLNIVQVSPFSLLQQDLAPRTKHCAFSLHYVTAEEVNPPGNFI